MDTIIVKVEKIIAGGDGLAFNNGKAHFIPGVLPGETVEIKVIEEKKGFNRANVIKIIDKSEKRVQPFCKYFGECGGCTMQYTNYQNQIVIKKQVVKDIFKRTAKIDLGEIGFIESKEKGYRNRIQLHYDGVNLGFKKNKSNDIIAIDECPLLVQGLNHFIQNPNNLVEGRNTLFSNGIDCKIGGVDKENSIDIAGHKIWFNPGSFFQSNVSILPELIKRVNEAVIGTNVMDLYCGVGFFSSFLTDKADKIVAVEMDSKVKPFIDKNVKGNIDFYNLPLEKYVKRKSKLQIDTIVVDPPRKGLSKEVRDFITKSNCKRVIYVSCDPVTMARDIGELRQRSFNLNSYTLLDFYPHTPHIESLGVLDRV